MNAFLINLIKKVGMSLLLLTAAFAPARAQGVLPQQGEPMQNPAQQQQQDGDLLRQLNLTQDQVGRIRAIQEESREERRTVGLHVREAQRALDEAIYQDNVDENLVEQRARELAIAQAAAARLRALTELRIRRVLNPEQLNTFRMLRERARMAQQEMRQERRLQGDQPGQQPPRERLLRRQGGQVQGGANTGQQATPQQRERPAKLTRRP